MTRDPLTDQRTIHGALRIVLVALGLALAMSSFYIAPKLTSQQTAANPGQAQAGASDGAGGVDGGTGGQAAGAAGAAQGGNDAASTGGKSGSGGAGSAAGGSASCTGNNGGKTDVGVDAKSIHLAATEVQSGIGQSFLGPVRYGMQAVLDKTNRAGGVCGRQLSLTLKDDNWRADYGKQYIDNFIQSNQYFALAVVPSSEGLNSASTSGDLDNAQDSVTGSTGIPVVGSDGMLNSQYADPWIWPVAASTATSMRIMAHYEATHNAQSFAIVYNGAYKFGVEGAGAFKAQVLRDGGTLNSNCIIKLDPNQTDYNTQASTFNQNCGNESPNPVNFVALLLEPQTAETWLGDSPYLGHPKNGGGNGAAGPQPLFDQNFANKCGPTCSGMKVWTSFFPPVYPYNQQQPVQQFNQDLCSVDSNCQTDANSAFTEGGYVGMELLVAALKQTGANLTRQALAQTLDSMTFKSGLAADLTYHKGNHYANESMVPFIDQYGQSASFQILSSTPQADPCRGCKDPSL